jgi:enoyl-[acyl-carrier protein] reductase I
VAKAGLESCARYLARELGPRGIRVNLVASGPLRTLAAGAIPEPGAADASAPTFEQRWAACAPLGWNAGDAGPVARTAVALLSDWLPATTGEIVHADGGAHAADPYGPVRQVSADDPGGARPARPHETADAALDRPMTEATG